MACGQHTFGENYVKEALEKIAALPNQGIEWHFIGPLQSNKTRAIAENFAWVHSVDRAKIAERLSAARPAHIAPLQICIQVNIGGEDTKSGVAPADAAALARAIAGLPRLKLRGLMAIPPPSSDFVQQRRHFAVLRELKEQLAHEGVVLDTLSMGMSADLEAAVAEGATLVRIGTSIFGERHVPDASVTEVTR
jgi:pyridoxal phosphate enzyme (YggS family)